MKKFILMMALLIGMVAMQSCKCEKTTTETQMGLDYSLTVAGDANGNLQFNFPLGHASLNGNAVLDVLVSNDTTSTPVLKSATKSNSLRLEDALESNDEKYVMAATNVNDWLVDNFSATAASGDYYVHLFGYVRERVTKLTFFVDREFTNREMPVDSTVVK